MRTHKAEFRRTWTTLRTRACTSRGLPRRVFPFCSHHQAQSRVWHVNIWVSHTTAAVFQSATTPMCHGLGQFKVSDTLIGVTSAGEHWQGSEDLRGGGISRPCIRGPRNPASRSPPAPRSTTQGAWPVSRSTGATHPRGVRLAADVDGARGPGAARACARGVAAQRGSCFN